MDRLVPSRDHYYYYSPDGSSSRSTTPSPTSTHHHFLHHYHQQQQQFPPPPATPPSRYESQKRRDWNTFGQYLRNLRPPVPLSHCTTNHVLDFLRYLDQFGKTKVHLHGCMFFGQPDQPSPCACPFRQAWGSLDALIGRLRAAYEKNGGSPETNPFAGNGIRAFLKEVKECQSKARGIPYKKKKKSVKGNNDDQSSSSGSSSSSSMIPFA